MVPFLSLGKKVRESHFFSKGKRKKEFFYLILAKFGEPKFSKESKIGKLGLNKINLKLKKSPVPKFGECRKKRSFTPVPELEQDSQNFFSFLPQIQGIWVQLYQK